MCIGPLKRFCHWGPLTALGIVKLVSFMMIHCSNMALPPTRSMTGFLNLAIFLLFSSLTVYNFLSAVFEGPGFLPLKWLPESAKDEVHLQYCTSCDGYKSPRSHHCRKCGRCVLKMDHHCPWINTCVGHANHAHFALFLFFSVCGCFQSTLLFCYTLYQANNRMMYMGTGSNVHFTLLTLILCVLALSLSIGVVIAVGMLLYFQLKSILTNKTGIEEWIVEKAKSRRAPNEPPFIYPYDLGYKKNFFQVINFGLGPYGDGLTWPVVEGCDQFTLTIEQKSQKLEKRARTRSYKVIKKYSGRWFTCYHGFCVCIRPPFTDEARIPLTPGQTVRVTRWRQYWLFGEIEVDGYVTSKTRLRGWFPKNCVVELPDNSHIRNDCNAQQYENKKNR